MIRLEYPGKLFLVGEFSIMESGHEAVIAAVNRLMSFTIRESEEIWIDSDLKTAERRELHDLMPHLAYALDTSEAYLAKQNIALQAFSLEIRSDLHQDKQKYGLGSSAVVMAGTMDAVLRFHGIYLDKLHLFKLLVLAQFAMDDLSSGGDLAASLFGGIVHYCRYDVAWLKQRDHHDLELIEEDWPLLAINKLKQPTFHLLAGWTQKPNQTQKSLVQLSKHRDDPGYKEIMESARVIVRTFVKAWEMEEREAIQDALLAYRKWMHDLDISYDLNIEISALKQLMKDCDSLGIASKVSGSGGGDCGIALAWQEEKIQNLRQLWLKHGILYLDIKIWEHV